MLSTMVQVPECSNFRVKDPNETGDFVRWIQDDTVSMNTVRVGYKQSKEKCEVPIVYIDYGRDRMIIHHYAISSAILALFNKIPNTCPTCGAAKEQHQG